MTQGEIDVIDQKSNNMPQLTTNNLEWEEEFDKRFDLYQGEYADLISAPKLIIKQFISDLRKRDEEELIKIADKGEFEDMRREVINYYK